MNKKDSFSHLPASGQTEVSSQAEVVNDSAVRLERKDGTFSVPKSSTELKVPLDSFSFSTGKGDNLESSSSNSPSVEEKDGTSNSQTYPAQGRATTIDSVSDSREQTGKYTHSIGLNGYSRLCWLAGFFQGLTSPDLTDGKGHDEANELAELVKQFSLSQPCGQSRPVQREDVTVGDAQVSSRVADAGEEDASAREEADVRSRSTGRESVPTSGAFEKPSALAASPVVQEKGGCDNPATSTDAPRKGKWYCAEGCKDLECCTHNWKQYGDAGATPFNPLGVRKCATCSHQESYHFWMPDTGCGVRNCECIGFEAPKVVGAQTKVLAKKCSQCYDVAGALCIKEMCSCVCHKKEEKQ